MARGLAIPMAYETCKDKEATDASVNEGMGLHIGDNTRFMFHIRKMIAVWTENLRSILCNLSVLRMLIHQLLQP